MYILFNSLASWKPFHISGRNHKISWSIQCPGQWQTWDNSGYPMSWAVASLRHFRVSDVSGSGRQDILRYTMFKTMTGPKHLGMSTVLGSGRPEIFWVIQYPRQCQIQDILWYFNALGNYFPNTRYSVHNLWMQQSKSYEQGYVRLF